MPRALIAGCGYVGEAAAKLFLAGGWDVVAWTRSKNSAQELTRRGIEARAVELTDRTNLARDGVMPDLVLHCASARGNDYAKVYRDGAENLVRVLPNARLIFTSSTSVYAQRDGSLVSEESSAEPAHENGKILRAAEEIVLANGGTVLRLAGIYGPGRSFLLQRVLDRKPVALGHDHFVNQAHRDDIAAAILFLAQPSRIQSPRIFNVVDDAPTLRREILQWISRRLAIPLHQIAGQEPPSKRGDSNKRVSNARLRALGWQPTYPTYIEAFERSIFPAAGILPAQK